MSANHEAWNNALLCLRLRYQYDVPQAFRETFTHAHIQHVFDCILHEIQTWNNARIDKLQEQEHGILADQDPADVKEQRGSALLVAMRRRKAVHVMMQLLLCNGAPTSEFSIKACQYARVRLSQLHEKELPSMNWGVVGQ